jgi:hypothetical protein
MKKCQTYKLDLDLDAYGKDATRSDGLNRKCRKCNSATVRKQREKLVTTNEKPVTQKKTKREIYERSSDEALKAHLKLVTLILAERGN